MLRRNQHPAGSSSGGQPTSNITNGGNGLRKMDTVDEMYTNNIMDQDNNNKNKMNRKNQD